jgi:UDPglucose--hexose-1-phosphate uridylyltransferase
MPELRKDPIVDRWVIISPERSMRPNSFYQPPDIEIDDFCPLCPGNEWVTPSEVLAYRKSNDKPNGPGWSLRVVPNKFPALRIEGEINPRSSGVTNWMQGVGAHEVIIETPDHDASLADIGYEKVTDVLLAYKERILDLKKDGRFAYIHVFKNYGRAAGATLKHSHSQLIALPIIPEIPAEELAGATDHFASKHSCIFCDMISQEFEEKKRIIIENEHFVSIAPFASRFSFEMWILPKVHQSRFEETGREGLASLAQILTESLRRLNYALQIPPYNYFIHNLPQKFERQWNQAYHWHIEIIPKLAHMAGFEMGSGIFINSTPPEEAAQFLRELKLR